MKKYRDMDGKLTCKLTEICKATEKEGREYYIKGGTYLSTKDGREYVYIEDDGILIHFKSFDGYNLFVPLESCGTFLPDVATDGFELIRQQEQWSISEITLT